MASKTNIERREVLKYSALGILGLSIPGFSLNNNTSNSIFELNQENLPKHYPNINPEIIVDVVGKSHFDLEGVQKLVDKRPELARSVWEWRFGDFESAIGAASHVGRRDIALYLLSKGARPTLFTFAMLGSYDIVKATITSFPGIEKNMGPHGISLLRHAYAGERMKDKMSAIEIKNLKKTISFLESLEGSDGEKYIDVSPEEQKKFLGDYKYGTGENDGFSITINMRKLLSLGSIGDFGGALYKTGKNTFIYNGVPSVSVTFEIENDIVKSLTITDPDTSIVAKKIN